MRTRNEFLKTFLILVGGAVLATGGDQRFFADESGPSNGSDNERAGLCGRPGWREDMFPPCPPDLGRGEPAAPAAGGRRGLRPGSAQDR